MRVCGTFKNENVKIKRNERWWWRKIMKDIILWGISIGNGYCRCWLLLMLQLMPLLSPASSSFSTVTVSVHRVFRVFLCTRFIFVLAFVYGVAHWVLHTLTRMLPYVKVRGNEFEIKRVRAKHFHGGWGDKMFFFLPWLCLSVRQHLRECALLPILIRHTCTIYPYWFWVANAVGSC